MNDSSWPGISLSDDTIYMAYANQVYAIDSQTGEAQWTFPEKPANDQLFFAPPAVTDDMVVVSDYRDSLFALNPTDGKQQWSFKSDRSRFIGSAAVGEDLVYAATVNGTVHALDRETGVEEWFYATDGSIWSTPLLADGMLYVTSLDRHLYVLDAKTGNLSWSFSDSEEIGDSPSIGAMVGTPTLYEDVLYFGSFNNRVYAVSIEKRDVLWTYDTTNWVWSSPVIDEQNDQLIGADLDGHIFALDLEDGSRTWAYDASGPVVGAPVLGNLEDDTSVAYITCGGEPNLLILNTSDGKEAISPVTVKAEFPTMFLIVNTGTSTRPIPLFAPPVGTDELLLVGAHQGDDLIYALELDDLQEAWRFNPKEHEQKQKEEQGEEEPASLFGSPMNLLLIFSLALLIFTLFGRGRRQK
ncbi:MAG: PQQ-binding-like beta-propeller repeat protein [Anaerolineae bacterium]|nr:PQQ-binding-like beta-propeller repeat protein [Anaerolineae bacterium]